MDDVVVVLVLAATGVIVAVESCDCCCCGRQGDVARLDWLLLILIAVAPRPTVAALPIAEDPSAEDRVRRLLADGEEVEVSGSVVATAFDAELTCNVSMPKEASDGGGRLLLHSRPLVASLAHFVYVSVTRRQRERGLSADIFTSVSPSQHFKCNYLLLLLQQKHY